MKKYTLRIAHLILLFTITTAISMENRKQLKECLRNFTTLTLDLKQKINLSIILQNAITFLSQQPIILRKCAFNSTTRIDNNDLIVRENDNQISTWNLMTGQLQQTVQVPKDEDYIQIDWHFNDMQVKVWNNDAHEYKLAFSKKEPYIITTATTNGKKIATGFDCGAVNIRDIHTGDLIDTFQVNDTIYAIALYKNIMLTASPNNIQIWNLETRDSKTLQTDIIVIDAALYNDKAVIISQRGILQIWDVDTGTLLKTINEFSHDHEGVNIAINSHWAVALSSTDKKAWHLSPLQGIPDDNPLVWIKENSDILQGNLIRRACQATADNNNFILALPKKLGAIEENETREQMDGRIYFTLPPAVRAYLRNCLNIKGKEVIPQSLAI